MKILILLVLSFSVSAQDRYVLPKDIVEARDRVIASKHKLDRDILFTYYRLCQKKKINEAEHIEMLAYQEITGETCLSLVFRKRI